MWLSLQQSKADDYVFATGVTTSIREFCIKTFKKLNIELIFKGEGNFEQAFDAKTGKLVLDIDPQFSRPLEKLNPVGDYSKAKNILGWVPEFTIDDIINEMVEEDLKEEGLLQPINN